MAFKLEDMGLKKQVPNAITLLNLGSGSIGVIFAVQGNLQLAALFVALGIFFDFFDGLAARLLNVQSEVGLQLDSLADVVTSGLVPAIVMFQLLKNALPRQVQAISKAWDAEAGIAEWGFNPWALFGLLIALASAYRLAKFNVDERQTDSFIGLPTPANALLMVSLPLILSYEPDSFLSGLIVEQWFLMGLTILSCILLNAEIKLFALKFANFSLQENWLKFLFLALCVMLILFLGFAAIPIIIISYVLLSLIFGDKA